MHRPMHAFTPAEYYRMQDVGVLTRAEHVELLRGYLVLGFPRDEQHKATVRVIRSVLDSTLSLKGWASHSPCRITLTDSVTEPDVVVLPSADGAVERSQSSSVGLVIEVANQSLELDRLDKLSIYARDGIPVYWIVNLVDRQVEVYEQPTGASPSPTYGVQRQYKLGDAVPVALGGANLGTIPVADLLP